MALPRWLSFFKFVLLVNKESLDMRILPFAGVMLAEKWLRVRAVVHMETEYFEEGLNVESLGQFL